MNPQPVRLSSLQEIHRLLEAEFIECEGWQIPNAYITAEEEAFAVRTRVGVSDVSYTGKLILKGEASGELLEETFGVKSETTGEVAPAVLKDEAGLPQGGGRIARLAADEILLLTVPGAELGAARRLEHRCLARDLFVSVVDQTAGFAGLLIAGPDSRELLSKLCALPFGPARFPDDHVVQTSVAKIPATVIRSDLVELPAYELYFERPYGEYMWAAIMDAGDEFGIVPFGLAARELLQERSI